MNGDKYRSICGGEGGGDGGESGKDDTESVSEGKECSDGGSVNCGTSPSSESNGGGV